MPEPQDTTGPADGRVLAIVGPTASSKSAVAMAVAARDERVEIVAVDAYTIYRGMDVGTAKPSAADRAAVRHHCLDLLEPDAEVTVSWFQPVARAAVADVLARGGVPLLVGGSGLYMRAVVDDMRFPPTDPVVRAALEERWAGRPEDAHAAVAAADPEAAARIEPGNLRRSVRALEVMEITGKPFSAYATAPYASVVGHLRVTYVEPPPDQHRAAVQARTHRMLEAGLLDEAERVRAAVTELSSTARQAIGYAEAWAVLDGQAAHEGLADAIVARTWGYARRQRSWFRRDPRCQPPARDVAAAVAQTLAALPPRSA